jgi:hypothetical protein
MGTQRNIIKKTQIKMLKIGKGLEQVSIKFHTEDTWLTPALSLEGGRMDGWIYVRMDGSKTCLAHSKICYVCLNIIEKLGMSHLHTKICWISWMWMVKKH